MLAIEYYDAIIIGGSYSGLAAGMALGRALRKVLIIDSQLPANRQTPFSHNFLTQDGSTPGAIARLAKMQVEQYDTLKFLDGLAIAANKTDSGFKVLVESGESFYAKKLIFATGIKDKVQDISGYTECWGISVLHCPYCHGYEYRHQKTGILGNGVAGFEFSKLISNWTNSLHLFTNGPSTLSAEQVLKLKNHKIEIIESEIERLEHAGGYLQNIIFKDNASIAINALYTLGGFEQHCTIPTNLGCEITEDGYIQVDPFQKTTVTGVFACGDNSSRMRTVANAVAMGTTTGIMVNKELVMGQF